MGGTQSKEKNNELDKFSIIRTDTYPNVCQLIEAKHSETQEYYLVFKSLYAIDIKEKEEQDIFTQQILANVPNTGKLLKFNLVEANQLCFQNFQSNLYFEYSPQSLKRMNRELKANNEKISEINAWTVLHGVAQHLKGLDNAGSTHGDLRPEYIFLTKGQNQVRIINPLGHTKFGTGYNVMLGESKTPYKTPLSPELLNFLEQKTYYPQVEHSRSDMFSVCLIILSLIVQVDWEEFYMFEKYSMNHNEIKINLAKIIKFGYSEELFYLLDQGLQRDMLKRPHINEFLNMTRFKFNELNK